jgi:hypothetical protein
LLTLPLPPTRRAIARAERALPKRDPQNSEDWEMPRDAWQVCAAGARIQTEQCMRWLFARTGWLYRLRVLFFVEDGFHLSHPGLHFPSVFFPSCLVRCTSPWCYVCLFWFRRFRRIDTVKCTQSRQGLLIHGLWFFDIRGCHECNPYYRITLWLSLNSEGLLSTGLNSAGRGAAAVHRV